MEKIDYIIAVIAIVAIGSGIYIWQFYSPQINASVKFLSGQSSTAAIYPYENVALPIVINNTGSVAIQNVSLEISQNGGLASYYKVTIPVTKETILYYNFTPAGAGSYNISAELDPAHVYNIGNRQNVKSNVDVVVRPLQPDQPYTLLPKGNYTQRSSLYSTPLGFEVAKFLAGPYNLSVTGTSQETGFDSVFVPFFNVTGSYMKNISIEYARYPDGSYAYSLWFDGYLTPGIMNTVLEGYSSYHNNDLSISKAQFQGFNVTVALFGNDSSLCSWYAGGWNKNLFYHGGASCYSVIANASGSQTTGVNVMRLGNNFVGTQNFAELANFSEKTANAFSYGNILLSSAGISVPIVSSKAQSHPVCYGLINLLNNTYYCTYYVSDNTQKIAAVSLVNSYFDTKQYNLSVLGLFNTSRILSSIPLSLDILNGYNLSKNAVNFTSGLNDSCSFGNVFKCANVTFANSTIKFDFKSNVTLTVNNLNCFEYPPGKANVLHETEIANHTLRISAPCYNGTSTISGIPLNLFLKLKLNFTEANQTGYINGTAYIIGLH